MRICLIFNPRAGTAERIKDFLLQLTGDQRCELRPTTASGDARRIAREAVTEGFDRIAVAGGDGTVGQVINGIAPHFSEIELAILPFGTGNDLARPLDLLADHMDLACACAYGARIEKIDVIRISAEKISYCINVANGGLGGRVAVDVDPADKKRWGPMAYWMTSVSQLVDLDCFDVELTLDDDQIQCSTYGVAIANGQFVGGGFPIAPMALLNDGFLDITVVPVLSTLELAGAGINFMLGRNDKSDDVRTYRSRRATIRSVPEMPFSVDGEPTCQFDATFEILPQVLNIVVGDKPTGLLSDSSR